MKCPTCGLNERYNPDAPSPRDYDSTIECEGCHVRNGNIYSLLEGILKAAQYQGLVRGDVTLGEFEGPTALQCLSDMLKLPQKRILYESTND
jgi:hypothetical protein